MAISPQTVERSRTTIQKASLTFQVLSDAGNVVARQFGLVFRMPEELHKVYAELGISLPDYNGEDSFELPIPGSYVVDADRTLLKAFAGPDHSRRLDPAEILTALQERSAR